MDIQFAKQVFTCIDNTTLSSTDNDTSVATFCGGTLDKTTRDGAHVAAVCVYPRFVAQATRVLEGSGIKVAAVAGAFPHGQLPLELKVEEVKYAIRQGADEIDMVLSRGALLAGDDDTVRAEVAAMKQVCGDHTLKVILETGELPTPEHIRRAAMLAMEGGADFIKTSTGKSGVGATPEAAKVMLEAIADYVKICKKTIGFKAAGGISTPEEALLYADLAKKIMGDNYINSQTFRIGASRLTDKLHSLLTF